MDVFDPYDLEYTRRNEAPYVRDPVTQRAEISVRQELRG